MATVSVVCWWPQGERVRNTLNLLMLVLGCAIACHSSPASADDTQCDRAPWAAEEVSAEDGARLMSGARGECLDRVAMMTGEATLFEKRPGWSPGRVALAQHASGYYLRLVYKVPVEWSWYGVHTINPLVLGLEDGAELALYPACETHVSSAVFTGYFRASPEQLERLSVERVTYVKQFMTTPTDVESQYLGQSDDGLSYFVLHSIEEPPAANLQTLAQCMLQASEVQDGVVVVPTPPPSAVTEPAEKGAYSKKVQGKLWLEGFVGPSSYDPDSFGAGSPFFPVVNVDAPKVKGPEFGGAFGGAFASVFFIGGSYRQANYEIGGGLGSYKLMKVGLDAQGVFSMVPYVHPVIRAGGGYARVFGGNFSAAGLKTNGTYFTLGAGVRVPIVRWVSFVATFDWSYVTIYPKDGGGFSTDGQQLGGTFGLTLHFLDVK